ncbi:hypothetical protein ACFFGV_15210 [Pontibacillus salicampi]|uniref:Uncharacterized protein n=1 Tax=Pontibacillus salicampi TaxID=1449801 RepID=A0ABV6LR83_9BACI
MIEKRAKLILKYPPLRQFNTKPLKMITVLYRGHLFSMELLKTTDDDKLS